MKQITFLISLSIACFSVPALAKNKVLWDKWYTIQVGKQRYAYYNERFEIKKNRIICRYKMWKKESGFINEEHEGAISQNDAALTPLSYNFYSVFRTTQTKIDGNISPSGILKVKGSIGTKQIPVVSRELPKGTVFSIFFPIWIRKNLSKFKVGKSMNFKSFLEDQHERGYPNEMGTVTELAQGDFAKKKNARKFSVNYSGFRSTWWVAKDGSALRIESKQQNSLVQLVSKKEAKTFIAIE